MAGMDDDRATTPSPHPHYTGSIVIPAHDEARRGFRVLSTARRAAEDGFLVIVACNGCSDETASLARAAGLSVVELDVASKAGAMNAGDELAGDVFPRLYLDADVSIEPESLVALATSLDLDGPRAAGPTVRYETEGSPWLVRRYHSALETLPFLVAVRRHHLEGRGVYGVNAEGRRRFGQFPNIRADDTYVDRMFTEDEKRVLDAVAEIQPPRTLRDLYRTQTRSAQGSYEVAAWLAREGWPDPVDATSPLQGIASRASQHRRVGILGDDVWSGIVDLLAWLLVEVPTRARAAVERRSDRDTPWR
jgi:cellulose synthase/poly-beta-1,6-N-acetylglucosamine synthase-like glycosyltransferase